MKRGGEIYIKRRVMVCTAGEMELGWWNEGEYDGWVMWHVWRSGEMQVGFQ